MYVCMYVCMYDMLNNIFLMRGLVRICDLLK